MGDSGTIWEESKKLGASKKFYLWLVILFLLGSSAGGAGVYFYLQSDGFGGQTRQPGPEETKKLLDRVAELIVLPADEEPTIATVADPEKLKDQAFFSKAKKGDKVLIYTNAKKAILYDPVNHKIVEVAPLNLGETAGTTTDR